MSIVRVREGVQAAVFNHQTQTYCTLTEGVAFDSADPFVKANAWAFQSDSDVEQATAAPGEKRSARKS